MGACTGLGTLGRGAGQRAGPPAPVVYGAYGNPGNLACKHLHPPSTKLCYLHTFKWLLDIYGIQLARVETISKRRGLCSAQHKPRFLMHDNDGIFGQFGRLRPVADGASSQRYRCALDAWLYGVLGIRGLPIPYGAPNAQAHIERYMGTLKREALYHFIFFSEEQLRRTAIEFTRYYNQARPHQGIDGIPVHGPGQGPGDVPSVGDGEPRMVARPVLGGLHHDYCLAA